MNVKKLVKSGFIYTLGNLLIQGLAFITLPVYTRAISVEVYGQYSLYGAWVGIFTLFIGLQTNGSLSSAKVKYVDQFEDYAVSAFTVGNLFFIVAFACIYMMRTWVAQWLGFTETILLIMALQSYVTYVVTFLGQYFIQHQKSMANLILSFFNAVMSVILSLTFIFQWEDDFLARVLGASIPLLVTGSIAFFYLYSRSKKPLQRQYIPFILSVSLPLIFHLLGHQLLNHLDRIMLANYFNPEQVAIYSFGYSLGMIIQIVLMSLNTAWVPWFFEARKKKDAGLPTVISHYLWLGVFLTLGYLTIFPELAQVMGGEKYVGSIAFIAIIIVSYFFVFLYTFPVNIQFYHANTKWIPVGTLIASAINFVLNLLLIPILGAFGAALTTAISYFCLLVLHHTVTKRLYRYQDVHIKQYAVLILTVLGYATVMSLLVDSLWLRWGLGVVVIIVYYIVYRQQIRQIIERIRTKKQIKGE